MAIPFLIEGFYEPNWLGAWVWAENTARRTHDEPEHYPTPPGVAWRPKVGRTKKTHQNCASLIEEKQVRVKVKPAVDAGFRHLRQGNPIP
jgi:hypothetical protein